MTHPTDDRSHLEVLYRQDCLDLLANQPVGRVGFRDGDEVIVLPVNYILHDDAVVFRTSEGSKLTAAVQGQRLAFEVDEVDSVHRVGWSVLVRGDATLIDDQELIATYEMQLLFPWSRTEKDFWVRLPLDRISGRRIRTVAEENRMDPRTR